uniref:(northern house mosquito) hypothetical protein n=1 Tax=Culex pipiens TaxID=7175 RepID=A0A8D8BVT1_CULPI
MSEVVTASSLLMLHNFSSSKKSISFWHSSIALLHSGGFVGLLPDADVVVEAVVLVTAERVLTHIKPKMGTLGGAKKTRLFFRRQSFPCVFFPRFQKGKSSFSPCQG